MSDELKSFKISDATPKGDQKRTTKGGSDDAGAPASVGFPHIEAEVEHDGPSLAGLAERLALLEDMAKSSTAQKDKAAAKKASLAYERTRDLVEHLLATKAQLSGGGSEG